MLKHVRHVLRTKGALLAVRRLFDIVVRFGFGRRRFRKLLEEFDKVFIRKGIKATFFVTGSVLDRHISLVRQLEKQGHCLAVHGHYHVRMDRYSRQAQRKMAASGAEVFRKYGFEPHGFRPPYLNYNQDTLEVLREEGYSWVSCRYLLNGLEGKGRDSAGKLEDLYHISSLSELVSIPSTDSGMLDLPVTGPDDELMIDRYRISEPGEMLHVWLESWRMCHRRGEIYHLMFHPERFMLLSGQIQRLAHLIEREGEKVWTATLGEIAAWWEARSKVEVELAEEAGITYAFFRNLPVDATVLLSGRPVSAGISTKPELGGGRVLDADRNDARGRGFICTQGRRKCVIGLSGSSPRAMEEYLVNEGFIVLRDSGPEECSLYLDREEAFLPEHERKLLEEVESSGKPLLRLWRWPDGHESVLTFSADICAIDFWDFVARSWYFHNSGK